ncbi:MAG: hypothetical protein Q4D81_11500 [Eubacteriales bacterium]|nr:hypothetical protein [Eubacteriales bacterium]
MHLLTGQRAEYRGRVDGWGRVEGELKDLCFGTCFYVVKKNFRPWLLISRDFKGTALIFIPRG